MNDTDGGSPSAARSAQDHPEPRRGGLLGRLVEAFAPARGGGPGPEGAPRPANGTGNPGAAPDLVNLDRLRIQDVAVPRAEIVAVPETIGKAELVQKFSDSGHTRLPVYRETLDSPVGLVHMKDFALQHGFNGPGKGFTLRGLVRSVLYAPPSMQASVLLQNMRDQRIHMALVVDEFGGVDGLVTIEDLIEQVIGEITDEHDVGEGLPWLCEKPGRRYLAQARTPLDDFQAEIDCHGEIDVRLVDPANDEEVETLGGLVFMLAGRVPTRGEVIRDESTGVEFEVVEADPRRVRRVRVFVPGKDGDGKDGKGNDGDGKDGKGNDGEGEPAGAESGGPA